MQGPCERGGTEGEGVLLGGRGGHGERERKPLATGAEGGCENYRQSDTSPFDTCDRQTAVIHHHSLSLLSLLHSFTVKRSFFFFFLKVKFN